MSTTNNQASNYPPSYPNSNEAFQRSPPYSSHTGSLGRPPSYSSTDLPPVHTRHANTTSYASPWEIDLEANTPTQSPTDAPRIRAPDMVYCSSTNRFAPNMEPISVGEAPTATPAPWANYMTTALRTSTLRRRQRADFTQRDMEKFWRECSCYGFIGVLLCLALVSLVIAFQVKKPSQVATDF